MTPEIMKKLGELIDKIRNRSYLLSYPNCGRTWLLNVSINYLYKKEYNINEPLELFYNQKYIYGNTLRKYGVVFTHGFYLHMNTDKMNKSLHEGNYINRKTCLVIRNPAKTLYVPS